MKKFLIFSLLCLVLVGCKPRPCPVTNNVGVTASAPLVQIVEDEELARLLINPQTLPIVIHRDPFTPLMASVSDKTLVLEESVMANLHYLGSVRVGKVTSALLTSQGGKGVFQVGDKVGKVVVKEINLDTVVFQYDKETFTIKRGE